MKIIYKRSMSDTSTWCGILAQGSSRVKILQSPTMLIPYTHFMVPGNQI